MKHMHFLMSVILILAMLLTACNKNPATPTNPSQEPTSPSTNAPTTLGATVISVSTTGDDSADGVTMPVKSVSKALELAAEKIKTGDVTIEILGGTHYITEALNITQNNTSREEGYVLTLRGNDDAVISGGKEVTGWEKHEGSIWKANVDLEGTVNGFYADGEPMLLARKEITGRFIDAKGKGGIQLNTRENYTNFAEYNTGMKIIDCYFTTSSKYQIDLATMQAELDNIKMYFDQTFTRTVLSFKEVTATKSGFTLRSDEQTLNMLNGAKMADYNLNANRYYLVNSYLFLDQEGEYYYNEETNTMYYYSAKDPNEKYCVIPVSEGLLNIQGAKSKLASNIRIENLIFEYGTDPMLTQQSYKQLQSESFAVGLVGEESSYKRLPLAAQITINCASNLTIDGCIFRNFDSTAIGLREYVYNTAIINSDIRNMQGSGISVGTFNLKNGYGINDNYPHPEDLKHVYAVKKNSVIPADLTIQNNLIENCGLGAVSNTGIQVFYAWNAIISSNTVSKTSGTGISVGWGFGNHSVKNNATKNNGNILVEKNKITYTCLKADDAGAIYTLGAFFGDGCIIRDNFVDMTGAIDDDKPCIYLDEGSELVTVTNNVFVNTRMWLHCRALPLVHTGGKVEAGSLAGNSIMNSKITGNYTNVTTKMLGYGGQPWPYASAVPGANVTISNNTTDQAWRNNETIMAIVDAAGAKR